MKGVARCAVLAVLLAWAGRAGATYRADFFDTSKRPTVAFDKGRMTWTLRNQGVERVIHFDLKAGALQTVVVRDLRTHHVLLPVSGGEGEITFASPLLETPTLLTGWKVTETNPGPTWTRPDFEDKAWQSVQSTQSQSTQSTAASPVRPDAPIYWYRVSLPATRLKAGHAYALYFPQGFAGDTEIYANGGAAQTAGASASHRPEQIDLPAMCRSIAVKTLDGPLPPAYLVEVGTSPPALQLTGDWQYMQHTVNVGEDNSKILTIHLSGVKRYEGLDLDVCYQVYAGEEPTLAKWFTFVNHRKSRFLMDTVVYDRWELPAGFTSAARSERADTRYSGFGEQRPFVEASAQSGDVLMTGAIDAGAMVERGPEGNTVEVGATLNVALKPNQPQQTPQSVMAFWHGPQAAGQFLYQLYVGQYVTSGGPFQTPITYGTRFPYGDSISAALCEKIVPLAAGLGAQAFVLDDGWQTNTQAGTGNLGDWIADKVRFPLGIAPVSLLTRENHLRFGLWVDAARVDARSQQASQHADWLYKPLAPHNEHENGEDNKSVNPARMCFTGAWARQFTQSMLSLCREQSVTILKTRFAPLNGCMSTEHEHPVGQNLPAEQEAWTEFRETLGAIKPEFTQIDDVLQEPDRMDPLFTSGKSKRVGAWLEAADTTLPVQSSGLEQKQAFLTPPFLECAAVFCHLPTEDKPTPDQMQWLWTRAAVRGPNFEIQGDLQQMTSEEREIGRKWIAWNLENRDWLAYAQPVTIAPGDSRRTQADPPVHIDAVLHLRNALRGRCGYLCLWNRDNAAATFTPSFTPSDYFVRVRPASVEIVNINGGKPVPFSIRNGAIALDKTTLPAYGWAIYEIKAK
jgi:hypothetical protein